MKLKIKSIKIKKLPTRFDKGIWVDSNNRILKIKEMHADHLINTINFIKRYYAPATTIRDRKMLTKRNELVEELIKRQKLKGRQSGANIRANNRDKH